MSLQRIQRFDFLRLDHVEFKMLILHKGMPVIVKEGNIKG